jgi:hypothetical protein
VSILKKRWWIAGAAVVVLLGGGYALKQFATAKIGDQVVRMINEPDVKKAIDSAIAKGTGNDLHIDLQQAPAMADATPSAPASTNQESQAGASPAAPAAQNKPAASNGNSSSPTGGSSANTPDLSLKNRDDAVAYAQSKFSVSEIANYLSLYKKKDQLSSSEKASIKAEILSRFSASELKALQEAASK